jgi:signal transduction histidine kinase
MKQDEVRNAALSLLKLQEQERRRVSRHLHDAPAQNLALLRLQLEVLDQSLSRGASGWREQFLEICDLTDKIIIDIRRLTSELSPAVVQNRGLAAGVQQLLKRFADEYPCKLQAEFGDLPALDPDFQVIVYRLVQECFRNIQRHSYAKNVRFSLTAADKALRLHVEDDGVGFNVQEAFLRENSTGIVGIRELVTLLGGDVSISSPPRRGRRRAQGSRTGTSIEIQVPIPEKILELGH